MPSDERTGWAQYGAAMQTGLIAGIGAVASGLSAWFISRRLHSGQVATTPAETLWAEATKMRDDLREEMQATRDELVDARAELASARVEARALRKEVADLRSKVELLERELAAVSRKQDGA
jgi:chromosome segregation ATPase